MALLKLAALGTLGYVGYQYYQKNFAGHQAAPAFAGGQPSNRHTNVRDAGPDAMRDDTCRRWIEEWWDAAAPHLTLPAADVAAYRAALTERFANPRMAHRLDQIAFDGSQKLPIRTLPVLRLEVAAGRVPVGAVRPLAAWVCHLRGHGAAVTDARIDQLSPLVGGSLRESAVRVLGVLAPDLAADTTVVDAVVDQADELEAASLPA